MWPQQILEWGILMLIDRVVSVSVSSFVSSSRKTVDQLQWVYGDFQLAFSDIEKGGTHAHT